MGKETEPNCLYNQTKGSVDRVDLIYSKLFVRMKLRWWAINPFAFNLDTVHTNAKVIVKETSNSTFLYLISYK